MLNVMSVSATDVLNSGGSYSVQIAATEVGEGGEPGSFLRGAISALSWDAAKSDITSATLTAYAMMDIACYIASEQGRWSKCGLYDPLPAFLELEELANSLLKPIEKKNRPAFLFRKAIGDKIRELKVLVRARSSSE